MTRRFPRPDGIHPVRLDPGGTGVKAHLVPTHSPPLYESFRARTWCVSPGVFRQREFSRFQERVLGAILLPKKDITTFQ